MTNDATTLSQLQSHLWEAANILRWPVDAADLCRFPKGAGFSGGTADLGGVQHRVHGPSGRAA